MILFKERMVEKDFTNMSEFIRTMCIEPHKINKKFNIKLLYEINKMGNNLNQLTRKIHCDPNFKPENLTDIQKVWDVLGQILKKFCV
jgi:Bacterial mobilisation protein (MobC)